MNPKTLLHTFGNHHADLCIFHNLRCKSVAVRMRKYRKIFNVGSILKQIRGKSTTVQSSSPKTWTRSSGAPTAVSVPELLFASTRRPVDFVVFAFGSFLRLV